MTFDHGGDWAGYFARHGTVPLDFSSSISPLGLPKGVGEAIVRETARADRYPDPFCRALRGALCASLDVPSDWILCGNGAGDLIERLVQAVRPKRAVLTAPTFSEYAAALQRAGCEVSEHLLVPENGFRLTEEILSVITDETDLVILCEPNNPTGVTTAPALLRRIMERCDRFGALLAVDECFNGLLSDPSAHTLKPWLGGHRLLLLDAFTKLYAMPGIRLGFALCADGALLEKMRRCGQPWPVSGLAQAAGISALEDTEYPDRLRALLEEQRAILRSGLIELGAASITGEANYLLFRHADAALADKLEPEGILIRRCDAFAGLGPGWFRTAVRTAGENQRLLQAIRKVIK